MRDECEHGMLRRKCDRCEEHAEIAALRTRLAESEAEVTSLKADRENAWTHYAACAGTPLMADVLAERDDLLGALRDLVLWFDGDGRVHSPPLSDRIDRARAAIAKVTK